MNRFTFAVLICTIALITLPICAETLPSEGDWVTYRTMSSSENYTPKVSEITLTVGPSEQIGDVKAVWWEMSAKCDAPFTIRVLSDQVPMSTTNGGLGSILRYIFREDGGQAIEYVDADDGSALLPMFEFREHLVPVPVREAFFKGPFASTGNYIGQGLALASRGKGRNLSDIGEVKTLRISDDITIATGRSFKDVGDGRIAGHDDYFYKDLDDADYENMIQAGFNMFGANDKNLQFVIERPTYFKYAGGPYPTLFYRSNFAGRAQYMDEPGIRMDPTGSETPADAANMLRNRCAGMYRDYSTRIAASTGPGLYKPVERNVPFWETLHVASWYELQHAYSIVHEGRYKLRDTEGIFTTFLGPGVTLTTDEMLRFEYAFMRGAARCFDGEWGTSIYNQMQMDIRFDAVRVAYEMGAHYLWFWTGGISHAIQHKEQLELASYLRELERTQPRGDRQSLKRAARVAVAFPAGYTLWCFGFDSNKTNDMGVTYKQVQAAALYEILRLLKQGVDFDIVIDSPEADNAGYERLIKINRDGTTSISRSSKPLVETSFSLELSTPHDLGEIRPDIPRATAIYLKPGTVNPDGDLSEWRNAKWFVPERIDTPTSPENLSAKVAFAWEPDALCVAAVVKDDMHAQSRDPFLMWQQDCMQIAGDPMFQRGTNYYQWDDFEIGFALKDGEVVSQRWYNWYSGPIGPVHTAKCAIIRKEGETIYEAVVPFDELKPLSPALLGMTGMNVMFNDADGDERGNSLQWTRGTRGKKVPAYLGVLNFQPNKTADPGAVLFTENTVVRRGEPAILNLGLGSWKKVQAEIEVTVIRHGSELSSAVQRLVISEGRSAHLLKLDTDSLDPDSYEVKVTLRHDGRPFYSHMAPFYVLP